MIYATLFVLKDILYIKKFLKSISYLQIEYTNKNFYVRINMLKINHTT